MESKKQLKKFAPATLGLGLLVATQVAIGKGGSGATGGTGKETVAEGVFTTRSALALAVKHHVEMPIVAAVARILFEGYPAPQVIADIMGRELRTEVDG